LDRNCTHALHAGRFSCLAHESSSLCSFQRSEDKTFVGSSIVILGVMPAETNRSHEAVPSKLNSAVPSASVLPEASLKDPLLWEPRNGHAKRVRLKFSTPQAYWAVESLND